MVTFFYKIFLSEALAAFDIWYVASPCRCLSSLFIVMVLAGAKSDRDLESHFYIEKIKNNIFLSVNHKAICHVGSYRGILPNFI